MKIGIIVEGKSEYNDLYQIINKTTFGSNQILAPLFAPMQPKASPMQIARSAKPVVGILASKGVQKIVVLIDKENQDFCICAHARALEAAFTAFCGHIPIEVVIKNKQFENWLIADINNLKTMNDFKVSQAFTNKVSLDKADNQQNPIDLLEGIMIKRATYAKGTYGKRIVANINPMRIAGNSRSFRRFLRVLGHPQYLAQSKKP